MKTQNDIIREMADSLLCGMLCFYQKSTNSFIEYPKEADYFYMNEEENPWQELMDQVENNEDDYIAIDPIPSFQYFKIMEEFAKQADSIAFSEKLLNALDRNKPFQNFNHLVENDFNYREKWFDFRLQKNMDWVERQIELK